MISFLDKLLNFAFEKDNLKKIPSEYPDEIKLNFSGSYTIIQSPISLIIIYCVGKMTLTKLNENKWSVTTTITITDTESKLSGSITHTVHVKIPNAENATAAELILDVFKEFSESAILFTVKGDNLELVSSKSAHKSFIQDGVLFLGVYIYPE
jgi:hypothetical protein